MGKQKVFVENFSASLYNNNQNTAPVADPPGMASTLLTGHPNIIDAWMDLYVSGSSTSNLPKAYIRQMKIFGIATNFTNASVILQMTHFKFRKDVFTSEYSDVASILDNDSAYPIDSEYMAPVTRSPTAQQLLIFGKTKYKILAPGRMVKFRINQKFRGGLAVTRATYANVSYLGRARITRGIIFKVIPPGVTYENGSSGLADFGAYPAGWNVNIIYSRQISGYTHGQDGDNVPGTSFGQLQTPGIEDNRSHNNPQYQVTGEFLPDNTNI